ncbi:hypothetical protein D3C81_1397150 [compost metagenome]
MVRDIADQQTRQCGDRHIEQEADRHVVGLEVDPDHRPQLEVDEQQQDVIDADTTLAEHIDEGRHRRIGSNRTDAEQGQVVKCFDAEVAQRVRRAMQAFAQFVCPFDVHDFAFLDTAGRMMRHTHDAFSACSKKARGCV